MKKRNKIASIVLFLAALAVGFDAQPGWSKFTYLLTPPYTQCDIASGVGGPTGIVVLPDGTVLVADSGSGLYSFKPVSPCPPVPPPATLLSSFIYYGMAVGLDGKIYANGADGNVYTVSPTTGHTTSTVWTAVHGIGMAVDPLTGDLFVTFLGPNIGRISGIMSGSISYNPSWAAAPTDKQLDGLAWSCDGTTLLAVSLFHLPGITPDNEIFKFTRSGGAGALLVTLPTGTEPDGIAFGAEGTPFAGYFFVNSELGPLGGTVYEIPIANNGHQFTLIASGGNKGDFVAADTKGNLLLTQGPLITVFSSTNGGQWVLPGSTLCSDLGCGAKAATTPQIDYDGNACLTGLNAGLVLTLSQSACGTCESCATLNQARTTLLELLNSLDPPRTCLNSLKATLTDLYLACPCNCPCPSNDPNCVPINTALSGGTCLAQTKFPLGIDLESYDPILQAFMRRVMSP